MDTNIVLALVMGLPGSGKTTLCKGLQSFVREDQGRELIHLCYDDLIPLATQREFVERRRIEEAKQLKEEKVEERKRNCISEKDENSEEKTVEEGKKERYLECGESKKDEEEEKVEDEGEKNYIIEKNENNEEKSVEEGKKERKEERYLQFGESKEEKVEEKKRNCISEKDENIEEKTVEEGKKDRKEEKVEEERTSISGKDKDSKTFEVKEKKVKEDTGNEEREERKFVTYGQENTDKEKKGMKDKIDDSKRESNDGEIDEENAILEDWKNERLESKIKEGNCKIENEDANIPEDWKSRRYESKNEERKQKNVENITEDWKNTRSKGKIEEEKHKIDEECDISEDWKGGRHISKNEEGKQKTNVENITEDWNNVGPKSKIEENRKIESEESDIPEDWKRARRNIHTQLDQLLRYLTTGTTDGNVNKLLGIPLSALQVAKQQVILLDDNFYYRSMRYEFYQLARKHFTAFCQLYLECSVEDAIVRNDSRVISVPTNAVTAMHVKLQPPQPDVNTWEGNTRVLSSGEVSKAWDVIEKSFHLGLTPIENRDTEIEEARKRCSLSVIHQADLTLRSIVKRLVKEELGRAGNAPKSTVPGSVNKARKAVLQELRGGLAVPCNLADAITQENRLDFELFLEEEMKRKMTL